MVIIVKQNEFVLRELLPIVRITRWAAAQTKIQSRSRWGAYLFPTVNQWAKLQTLALNQRAINWTHRSIYSPDAICNLDLFWVRNLDMLYAHVF